MAKYMVHVLGVYSVYCAMCGAAESTARAAHSQHGSIKYKVRSTRVPPQT